LLEAGPDLRAELPDDVRDGWSMTSEFDWGYTSEPDELGVIRKVRRVKLLGGTSSITRFALRGAPGDFDEWEALGNAGWGFNDVLPYLRRLETDADFGDQPWHGDSGPIPVDRYRDVERTEIHSATAQALEAAGFPQVEDHNRPGAVGVGRMPMSSRNGVRMTTAAAYLPVGGTPLNLTIRPDSQVAHVVFEGARATGVSLLDGTIIDARLVVLCAGTYGSPPVLMRSGIGAAEHLRSIGIPVRVDLPGVGANLADHPAFLMDSGYHGPAPMAPSLHSVATYHSSIASTDAPPDLMFWLNDPDDPEDPPQFPIDILLLKPRSRGSVRLRSADPADPPRIDLPNLREPSDLERLAEAYRRAREIAADPAIRRLCAGPLPEEIRDRRDLLLAVRQGARSVPHVVGTCSMGISPEDGAVVDGGGRVFGTKGLYVVDASIMPTVPSGFTHLPTIMIAERLSEQIAELR
ncbi:MAG TPA: GMC oxidoreductase, partial [Candidatus Limnocylindrales bacterium]